MRFFLMQRNHPVAVIEIAEKTGDIIDVAEVLSAQRIPLGAKHSDGSFDVLSLRKWWAGRGIPASRSGLERALETLHIPYAELLLVKCSGLSLSDQYWVTPCDAPQNWHDVNFYENDFSDDVGRALFGEGVLSAQPDLCSQLETPCACGSNRINWAAVTSSVWSLVKHAQADMTCPPCSMSQ